MTDAKPETVEEALDVLTKDDLVDSTPEDPVNLPDNPEILKDRIEELYIQLAWALRLLDEQRTQTDEQVRETNDVVNSALEKGEKRAEEFEDEHL